MVTTFQSQQRPESTGAGKLIHELLTGYRHQGGLSPAQRNNKSNGPTQNRHSSSRTADETTCLEILRATLKDCPEAILYRDRQNRTALHIACSSQVPLGVIRYLICQEEETISLIASILDHPEPVTPSIATPTTSFGRLLPLHCACQFATHADSLAKVEYLVKTYPDALSVPNGNGWLPLHIACVHNALAPVVQYLLEANPAAATEPDNFGQYSLHLACSAGLELDAIQAIYAVAPEVIQYTNNCGSNPLHLACLYNHLDVIKYLLGEWNDGIRVGGGSKRLPLHLACFKQRSLEIISYLVHLDRGTLRIFDAGGLSPLGVACKAGAPLDVIQFLVQEWPSSAFQLGISVEEIMTDILKQQTKQHGQAAVLPSSKERHKNTDSMRLLLDHIIRYHPMSCSNLFCTQPTTATLPSLESNNFSLDGSSTAAGSGHAKIKCNSAGSAAQITKGPQRSPALENHELPKATETCLNSVAAERGAGRVDEAASGEDSHRERDPTPCGTANRQQSTEVPPLAKEQQCHDSSENTESVPVVQVRRASQESVVLPPPGGEDSPKNSLKKTFTNPSQVVREILCLPGLHTEDDLFCALRERLREACEVPQQYEVIAEVLKAFPSAIYSCEPDTLIMPMHTACTNRAGVNILALLHAFAPDVVQEKRDSEGNLPLHLACYWGAPTASVQYLISKCPEAVLVVNNSGETPRDKAKCPHHDVRPNPETIHLLARHELASLGTIGNAGLISTYLCHRKDDERAERVLPRRPAGGFPETVGPVPDMTRQQKPSRLNNDIHQRPEGHLPESPIDGAVSQCSLRPRELLPAPTIPKKRDRRLPSSPSSSVGLPMISEAPSAADRTASTPPAMPVIPEKHPRNPPPLHPKLQRQDGFRYPSQTNTKKVLPKDEHSVSSGSSSASTSGSSNFTNPWLYCDNSFTSSKSSVFSTAAISSPHRR